GGDMGSQVVEPQCCTLDAFPQCVSFGFHLGDVVEQGVYVVGVEVTTEAHGHLSPPFVEHVGGDGDQVLTHRSVLPGRAGHRSAASQPSAHLGPRPARRRSTACPRRSTGSHPTHRSWWAVGCSVDGSYSSSLL